ncbi:hypothetical protein JD79_04460 [Geodermatophilus normandii]|uniref:Uncharacterized protein n=1 Tax=Geodermatophilus normandii TaxID=1137989 RepID=A0A317QQY6_9ACTN|nr:hypothetical protein JD79_04460 [Geodermatophilus normandii]
MRDGGQGRRRVGAGVGVTTAEEAADAAGLVGRHLSHTPAELHARAERRLPGGRHTAAGLGGGRGEAGGGRVHRRSRSRGGERGRRGSGGGGGSGGGRGQTGRGPGGGLLVGADGGHGDGGGRERVDQRPGRGGGDAVDRDGPRRDGRGGGRGHRSRCTGRGRHRRGREQLALAQHVGRVREALAVELLHRRPAALEAERGQRGADVGGGPQPRVVHPGVAGGAGDAQQKGAGLQQRDLVTLAEVAVGRDQAGEVADQHGQPGDATGLQTGPAQPHRGVHAGPHQAVEGRRAAAGQLQHLAGTGAGTDRPGALRGHGDHAGLPDHLDHPHDGEALGHEQDGVGDAPFHRPVDHGDRRDDGAPDRTAPVPAGQLGEQRALPRRLRRHGGQGQHGVLLERVGCEGARRCAGWGPGSGPGQAAGTDVTSGNGPVRLVSGTTRRRRDGRRRGRPRPYRPARPDGASGRTRCCARAGRPRSTGR